MKWLNWIFVPAAFGIGWFVVPVLIPVAWGLGFVPKPESGWLLTAIGLLSSLAGGFCGVWMSQAMAPSLRKETALLGAAIIVLMAVLLDGLGDPSSALVWLNVVLASLAALGTAAWVYRKLPAAANA